MTTVRPTGRTAASGTAPDETPDSESAPSLTSTGARFRLRPNVSQEAGRRGIGACAAPSADPLLGVGGMRPAFVLSGAAAGPGSIGPGRAAISIVMRRGPLGITPAVERAFVARRETDLSGRHTCLYAKYREKYRQLDERAAAEEAAE